MLKQNVGAKVRAMVLGVVLASLAAFANAQTAANAQTGSDFSCSREKKTQVCKRTVAVSDMRAAACRWNCRRECRNGQCIEICRGSGPECNGKSPW